jgi:predicted TIM-barrel fold metal-dependent hydrolase
MNAYTNIHTHIFNIECAPKKFIGIPLPGITYNRKLMKGITRFMQLLIPSRSDILQRYANFLLVGTRKNQGQLWQDLTSSYPYLKMKFVVHSLDMDKMEAGPAKNNYETQVTQLFEVKKQFPDQLLPFVCVDPRKFYPGGIRKYLDGSIKRFGFIGVKLYPALGFYPFDPELEPLYAFAAENNLPVMVHCTRGGIWFRGKIRHEHILPANFNPHPVDSYDYSDHATMKNRKFKDFFNDPKNFEEVLSVFPDLKICFAHFGGSSEIIQSENHGSGVSENNFYLKIKNLMRRYPNVYADVSYTLSEIKKVNKFLGEDLRDKVIRDRILFGTDFFMTLMENSEPKLVDDLMKFLKPDDFDRIAITNCRNYLSSVFYRHH